ncbi:MAG: MMPL family transporter, partial [Marinilabiliaceae bacterium]
GVDYSIFVMDGLLSKARSQSEPQLLVYHKTAIFFSAITLMVSTGSLLLASHPALASIGVATIIGMSSAVILAYSLQPFLYHALVKLILRMGWKASWLEVDDAEGK